MEIVELSGDEVRASAGALAQLLLDAHASNMALGLAAPLTQERARAAWLETADRLGPDRMLLAARDGGELVGSVQIVRATAENGRHRGEIQRLAGRAGPPGGGPGPGLLPAANGRGRERPAPPPPP